MKNGELTIIVSKIAEGDGIGYWSGELLYNDDSVCQVTSPDFYGAVDELLAYAQTENNVIDQEWFNN
jgi:hypothetical protein